MPSQTLSTMLCEHIPVPTFVFDVVSLAALHVLLSEVLCKLFALLVTQVYQVCEVKCCLFLLCPSDNCTVGLTFLSSQVDCSFSFWKFHCLWTPFRPMHKAIMESTDMSFSRIVIQRRGVMCSCVCVWIPSVTRVNQSTTSSAFPPALGIENTRLRWDYWFPQFQMCVSNHLEVIVVIR